MDDLRARVLAYKTALLAGKTGILSSESLDAPKCLTSTAVKPLCPKCQGQGIFQAIPQDHPERAQVTICDCETGAKLRRDRAARLRAVSDIPARFAAYTLETYLALPHLSDDQRQAARLCQQYSRQGMLEGKLGLFLWGNPGTGKSGLAASVSDAALQRGVTVLYRAVPDLLDYIRSAFNPDHDGSYDETFNQIKEVELLVLDDLGTENATAWVTEKLFQMIDYRYRNNLRMVITSNLSVVDLIAHYGKHNDNTGLRIADRIMEMCALISVGGNNLR